MKLFTCIVEVWARALVSIVVATFFITLEENIFIIIFSEIVLTVWVAIPLSHALFELYKMAGAEE